MGVDLNGMITVLDSKLVQEQYEPLLEAVRSRLDPKSFTLVHSVYVYGSVASGRAVAGRSDLDLSLVLRDPPSSVDSSLVEGIRQEIESTHPIVTKVDFDVGVLCDVLSTENGLAWQYWLKHHCRCIAGRDLAGDFPLFRPSRKLALAINGDFEKVLQRYQKLLSTEQPADFGRFIREASRKLIRSTNVLRSETGINWPETLEEHVTLLLRNYPERGDDMRYFLEQALKPDEDPKRFATRLGMFSEWMADEVRRNSR